MKIISAILIVLVAVMSFKKGFTGLLNTAPDGDITLLSWGINKTLQIVINCTTILVAVLILFPQTFLLANIIAAMLFVLLMGFQLNCGNVKAALIELPFLAVTFMLIYLGHPFKNNIS